MVDYNFELSPLRYDQDMIATENFLTDFVKNIFSFGKVDEKTKYEELTKFRDMLCEPQQLFGKAPETAQYLFTFKPVIVDKKKNIISIQRINYKLLFKHIEDTYGEKKLNTIFYRTYDGSDIKKFNKKRITRGQMRITSLISPMFFALELSILFSQLYKKYRLKVYQLIATTIYNESWLSEADNRIPEKVDVNYAKSLLNEKYQLKPYQVEFIEAYPIWKSRLNMRGVYNSFDQGLGKTLTSMCLAMALHADKIYVVCPNTLVPNWYNEVLDYYDGKVKPFDCKNSKPDPDTRVFITNNESIKNILPYIDRNCRTMLIIDEGHNFRNLNSTRVQELIDLRKRLQPRDVLPMSGTPLKASPNEMVPAFLLLDPLFTPEAAEIYNKCFNFDNYQAMEIVTSRLGKVIYRKMKKDVLELPNKSNKDLEVKIKNPDPFLMSNVRHDVIEEYKVIFPSVIDKNMHILNDFKEWVNKYSTAGQLATRWYISRICQAADAKTDYTIEQMHELDAEKVTTFLDTYVFSNPRFPANMKKQLLDWESKLIHFEKVAMGKAIGRIYPPRRNALFSAMWDENESVFLDMINNNVKKTVIFSQFYPVIMHIKERLEMNGIKTVTVNGKVNNNDRAKNLREFKYNEDVRVIIATSQSMGTGVTLTEASLMFFFGPPWRSTDFDQCCDRIYRIGQDTDVRIFNVILDTPQLNLSSKMDKILKWSAEMFHSAIDSTVVTEAANAMHENIEEFLYIYENEEYIVEESIQQEFTREIMPIVNWLNYHYTESSENIALEAAGYSEENKYPVFTLLTLGNNLLSKAITKSTSSSVSHASLSFDISLDPLYSFGTKKIRPLISKLTRDQVRGDLGFIKTNPYSDLWPDDFDTNYWLYVTFVNELQLNQMRQRLEFFINNADKLKYDFAGLARIFFGLKSKTQKKWFCSRFVAEIINAGKKTSRDPSLWKPSQLPDMDDTELVISGKNIKEYNVNEAKIALEKVKKCIANENAHWLGNYTIAEEGYLFNETPIFLNYDRWLNKDTNILYITGLSGSGKGYLSKKISEKVDNCTIFELDKFENYMWFLDSKDKKEHPAVARGDKIIFKYLNDKFDLSNDIFDGNVVKYNQLMKDFYIYLLDYIQKHPNTQFIMEGIQIYLDDAFKNLSNKDSIVLIRTSMVKSMQRVMDRDHCEIRNHLHTFIDFQKMLREFEKRLNIGKVKVATESSSYSKNKFTTPEELYSWMKGNITYSNFTRLKNPMEVYIHKKGSCHDQVVFEIFFLRQMGIDAHAFFLIESNNIGQGGMTHSFVYYKMNGKYYWFENAWEDKSGIHEYSSLKAITNDFRKMHKEGVWGNHKKYPRLEFMTFIYQINDSLQMMINRMFKPL